MTFHWYGFMIGIAIVVALQVVEWQARRFAPRLSNHAHFWWLVLGTCLGGIVGARLWHVATNWSSYASHPILVLYVWQGGLSILGAVAGGLLSAALLLRWLKIEVSFLTLADVVVFGLPFGQAIGRLGNYLNQELYGLPAARLPWSIAIDTAHRLPQFATYQRFHPLFAYELLAMLAFGFWFLRIGTVHKQKIGTGFFLTTYCMTYAWVRFWLDFIRIDREVVVGGMLGVNQVFLMGVFLVCLAAVVSRAWWVQLRQLGLALLGFLVIVLGLWASSEQQLPTYSRSVGETAVIHQLTDRQRVTLQLGDVQLQVEVVTTPKSWQQGLSGRSEIGSDGMLFVFPTKQQRQFWMVDMRFDLDMVWLADGVVLGVTRYVPKPLPGQTAAQLPTFASPGPADWVLEIPAGMASEYGIVPGMNGMIRGTSP